VARGEIMRDRRVVYVQPRNDLKVEVKADKNVYLPGEDGRIRFLVTDQAGRPTAAALGVIIVDEAVYALQDMQPGLEKVFFTLQEELTKPQAQIAYKPSETIDGLVREPVLPAGKQQIAEVLLTAVKPKPPARWEIDPTVGRLQRFQGQVAQVGWALQNYAVQGKPFMEYDSKGKRWAYKPTLLNDMIKAQFLNPEVLKGPFDNTITLDDVTRSNKAFSVDGMATAVTQHRGQQEIGRASC